MGPILNGYGYGCLLIVVNALLWTTRRKSPYATLNQLQQEQSVETATGNSHYSQQSGSVSCGRRCNFLKLA